MVMGIVEIIKYLHTKVTVSSPMLTSPRSSLVLQLHGRLAGVVEVGSLLPHIISQLHARLATSPREAGISLYCSPQIRDLDCTLYCLKYFSFYLGTNLGKIVTNLARVSFILPRSKSRVHESEHPIEQNLRRNQRRENSCSTPKSRVCTISTVICLYSNAPIDDLSWAKQCHMFILDLSSSEL